MSRGAQGICDFVIRLDLRTACLVFNDLRDILGMGNMQHRLDIALITGVSLVAD